IDPESLTDKTQDYLRRQLSELLKVPAHRIDPRAALENYGIDSILAMQLTNQLEKTFGSLSKTLFFEYRTIRELAEYFIAQHSPQLLALFAPGAKPAPVAAPPPAQAAVAAPAKLVSSRRSRRTRTATPAAAVEAEPIAIIGLSGRYPEALNLDQYWQNLRDGKDCIVEVPKERWDWREFFSDDRSRSGHHYSKWGGFIAGVDEFDPLFFNISPVEAEYIDPQERLFLQHAWMAIEDAGYTRAGLQAPAADDLPGQVGVYVGLMYTEYQLFGAEAGARGKRLGIAGSPASIANRVSYILNLHGPSMTLDSMCSSSLTAIHVACQDLKQGRTNLAIAGGVNVSIHPNKYLVLSGGQFISSDGHCQSFGEGGDGYIPGEGVGVVVLKRLSEAQKDGDHIYGVIRGSSLNHGGKTNGYTVPNPQAQTSAINRALAEARIDARHISYIEAHGTGTKLGDPIEIAALSKAFRQHTQDAQFCLIGSAKSNIGHCESAAGIAGLTKVLLQMQHQQIVPSLHSAQLNPHIDFPRTPFVVNQALRAWDAPVIEGRTLPRIAGISSFGAGGSNAHMIVEEYPQAVAQTPMSTSAPFVIVLSARSQEQLQQKARDLRDHVVARQESIDLGAVAYTLQVGREAMEERLGFIVSSAEQLVQKLDAFLRGDQGIDDTYHGRVRRNDDALSLFSNDSDLQQTVDKWLAGRKFTKLLDLWTKGLELNWSALYGEQKPGRVSLPTYPFARERYWIDITNGAAAAPSGAIAVLHPLLHSNVSDLSEQRFRATFRGDEFFLTDHQVAVAGGAAQKVLPAVAQLEMARAAIEQALPADTERAPLELRNIVWAEPIVVTGETQIQIALAANEDGSVDYEIYSAGEDDDTIHSQGHAVFEAQTMSAS
ncbi:MAG TPA: beta-ketoacyl synthase N-terminal-like domain-containing protein, partial [Thermoanaerobaculia bacterium]